jgi:hypothetical protein
VAFYWQGWSPALPQVQRQEQRRDKGKGNDKDNGKKNGEMQVSPLRRQSAQTLP